MITVIAIKNPLDPWSSQEILYLPNGSSIDDCIDAVYPPIPTIYDLAVSYDGNLIDIYNPPDVYDNCSIVFIAIPQGSGDGRGKNSFKTILGALITAVGYILTPTYGIGLPLVGMGLSLMGSGIAGLLLTPSERALLESPTLNQTVASESNTYGWSTQSNRIGEGITLPELYGEMRVVPPLIGKYIQSVGEKQYLYMLFAICRWDIDTKAFNAVWINQGIKQVESALRGVYINDIEAGRFGDVVVEVTSGGNFQEALKGFTDARTDIAHSREILSDSYYEFDTTGSYINGIILSFVFPMGLFKTKTELTGTTSISETVDLYIQHAPYVSDDHSYADNEYLPMSGISIGTPVEFSGVSRWSAGFFNGQPNANGTSAWIEIFSDIISVSHVSGDLYIPPSTMIFPVGLIIPRCVWYKVENGVLLSLDPATITTYYPISNLTSNKAITVTRNLTTSFSVECQIANNPTENIGKRHIRCKRSVTTLTDFNGRDNVYIQLSQEIVNRDLTYPNVSLLSVQALATDKLSGSIPTISVVASRSVIWVYRPHPDHAEELVYWPVRADNPAWICYDLLHGARRVETAAVDGRHNLQYVQTGSVAKEDINYDNFQDWADFCDIHTKFHCFTKTETPINTTDWIPLNQAEKNPTVGDTFTTAVNNETIYTVTHAQETLLSTLVELETTTYTVGGVTSIINLSPSAHLRLQTDSTFTVTVETQPASLLVEFDGKIVITKNIGSSSFIFKKSILTTIEEGTVFTVGAYTDEYVVTSRSFIDVNSDDTVLGFQGYSGVVNFLPVSKQQWTSNTTINFGKAITPGIVPTYTVTEICAGSTIVFTPACDTIWPTGSILNVTTKDINLSTSIKVDSTGSRVWPANMALSFIDYDTVAAYPEKKKYTCNIYFDSTTTLKDALTTVGLCGRGSVVQEGSKYSCIVEKPEINPVQRFIFNMANIQDSSFEETWMSLDERSNCFEIKYWDKLNDYKEDTVTIQDDTVNDLIEMKRTTIDLVGCTDEHMAAAFGKFLINVNRYVTLTASWVAHVDSIGCFPGQIIEVQHDVPQFGYGGRLLDGCTTTKLIFDRDLTFVPDTTYEIIFYHQVDDTREAITYNYTGATEIVSNIIENLTGIATAPVADSKFIFGEVGMSSRLMRVTSITRDSDFKNKITAIEFENNVYSDGVAIEPRNVSNLAQELRPPILGSVTSSIVWHLNTNTKIYDAYIRIDGECGTINRRNTNPITGYKLYAHIEEGDTRNITNKNTIEYKLVPANILSAIASNFSQSFEYIAKDLIGKTIFTAMTQTNILGYESPMKIADPIYIVTSYDDLTTLNLDIDNDAVGSFQGFTYDTTTYTIYLTWTPIGWEIDNSKYIPIERWNNGSNWYMYTQYMIVYGFVSNINDTPAIADLQYILTTNIGDMFDSSNAKISDLTILHNNAIEAAKIKLTVPYSLNYLKIAVVAVKKLGGLSHLHPEDANYGLDWVPVRMLVPYALQNVLNTEIRELELIISTQNNTVFLNEIRWDYPLVYPKIDGFAIIYRIQNFWWAWPVQTIIPKYKTGTTPYTFLEIINGNYINFNAGGGMGAHADCLQQIIRWQESNAISVAAGMPRKYKYMYFTLTYQDQYEIIKVDIDSSATIRNTEKMLSFHTETIAVECSAGSSTVIINPTSHIYTTGDQFIVNNVIEHRYTIVEQLNQRTLSFTPNVIHPFLVGEEVIIGDLDNIDDLQAWPIGAVLSYLPNEWCDSIKIEDETSTRHYVFDQPFEINCALHMTIVAFKRLHGKEVDGTHGYERTPYSVWEAKLQ